MKSITAATLLICYCIQSIASTDIQQYVCVKSIAVMQSLNVNITGNANIINIVGGKIYEFSPLPNMDATFEALTPCRHKQRFVVHVDNKEKYNPDMLPEGAEAIIPIKVDGEENTRKPSSFPSCRVVFEEMIMHPGKCKVGEQEKVECTKWIDPEYESEYNLKCSTSFNLTCDFEDYSAPIEGHDGVFFFKGNIHGYDPTMPCRFKIRTVKGFQLLVPAKFKGGDPIDECIKSAKKETCLDDPPQTTSLTPSQTTKTPTSSMTNRTTTPSTTTNLTTTAITSGNQTSSSTQQSQTSFSACIKTVPFMAMLIVLPILIIILIMLVILKICRSSKKVNRKSTSRSNKKSNEYDDGNGLVDEHSWKATKSVFLGNEPNIDDNATLFEDGNGAGSVTKNADADEEEEYNYQDNGIDVPPTRED